MEDRSSLVQKCQMPLWPASAVWREIFAHYPKKIFFFCFLFRDTVRAKLQLWAAGHTCANTPPTWNCQSPEPVWLSPSTCRVWEGGRRGGPGLRLCPWAGAEAGFAALAVSPKPAVVLTTKAAAWYIIFLFSYYFILTNCLQPQGFSPQQHYLPPAVGNFALIWMLFVLRHTLTQFHFKTDDEKNRKYGFFKRSISGT